MKKSATIVLACLALVLCLASCGKAKGEVHVSKMEDFYNACTESQEKGTKLIVLDGDLVWDSKYNGSNGLPFKADVTGVTIDLNGYKIKDVSSKSFVLMGTGITVKNGEIRAHVANNRYALCFNWVDTDSISAENAPQFREKALAAMPASFDDSDAKWKDRIIVQDCIIEGLACAYLPIEIKNVKIENAPYKGMCLWGASGIIENVDVVCINDCGVSVANWGKFIVKGKGTWAGQADAIYAVDCGRIEFDADSEYTLKTLDDMATKTIYCNKKAAIILSPKTRVESYPGKRAIAMNAGSYIEIAKGTTLISKGEEVTLNLTGFYTEGGDHVNWSSTANADNVTPVYEGQTDFTAARIVDNRF